MKKYLLFSIIIFSALWFLGSTSAQAATINSASCSQIDVQAAVNSANPRDTVNIPACSPNPYPWSSGVNITKGITVQGSGESSTVISANSDLVFSANLAGGNFRLTGIGFEGYVSRAWVVLDGTYTGLRIDHLKFADIPGSRGIIVGYGGFYHGPEIKGLFDHLTVNCSSWKIFIAQYGQNEAWNRPDNHGSDRAIYIEDSTFTWTGGATGDVIDGEAGARFVVRHNTITDGGIYWHDTGSTPQARSTRLFEIYDNILRCNLGYCSWGAMTLRGGTGFVYNNIIDVYPNGWELQSATEIFRVYPGNGSKPWAGPCDGVVDRVCSDFMSHCSGGDHKACYGDWDCTGVGSCSIDLCSQDSDCGSGATCLAKFDGHLEANGWPCRDQIGRGQDDPVTHVQPSSPVFWWNNRNQNNNVLPVIVAGANADYIKENRDYCNHDPSTSCNGVLKSYVSYTYPHPCQTNWPACSGDSTPAPYCGDSSCNNGEACSTCPSDCGVCPSPTPSPTPTYFQPEQYIEAEAGTLSGLQTGISGSDTYVYTNLDNTGSASFTFNISQAGQYKMESLVNSNNDGGQNSFYLGLDSENAQNNNYYAYATPVISGFVWDNVNRTGNGTVLPEFDPMTWNLSAGLHTFTFYGREANTWLDQIILKRVTTDTTPPAAPTGVTVS